MIQTSTDWQIRTPQREIQVRIDVDEIVLGVPQDNLRYRTLETAQHREIAPTASDVTLHDGSIAIMTGVLGQNKNRPVPRPYMRKKRSRGDADV